MALIVITAPTVEPLTNAEIKTHLNIGATNQELAPGAPTVALAGAGAGNVENGAHRYRVTFVTADGETEGGVVSDAVTVADKTTNGKVAVSAIPTGGSAVTSRKLYRTIAGGTTYLLLTTIADNSTTTYTDNIADATLGAGCPTANTTADPYLTSLIKGERTIWEKLAGMSLLTQTLELILDAFPDGDGGITLPNPPIQSITSIKYIDEDGVEQTLSSTLYDLDSDTWPSLVAPAYDEEWPDTRDQINAVRVRYVAGYTSASLVPEDIKSYMKIKIGTKHVNREDVNVGLSIANMRRDFIDGILDDYRYRTIVNI